MQLVKRVTPCYQLSSGADSVGCRPADDIVVPLVGDSRRLDEIAQDALNNPDSDSTAYTWRRKGIITTGFRRFKEGETFSVEYLDARYTGVIFGPVSIQQADPNSFTQSFTVYFLIPD